MPTKSKKRKYIDPEGFYVARRRSGLTMEQTADLIDVDIRTIRNWENGSVRIPYCAFRLMRLLGGYALLGKEWEGWAFWDGKLFSPAGRSFLPHELLYISHYISMARLFIKSNKAINADSSAHGRANARQHADKSLNDDSSGLREKASPATAGAGVSPFHEAIVINVDFSRQKKTKEHFKSQQEFMFGKFSSYRRAAANEAYYR
jgi:transcriptional regulator with XRE-family HTH domain